MRYLVASGAIVLLALAAGGCATARAQTQPGPLGLEVPAPPPRVVQPPPPEAPPDLSPPETEPRTERPRPGRSGARPEARREAPPQKPDPTPPVEPPKPAPSPAAGTLQPALPTPPTEVERQVHDQLAQANATLERVDYRQLSTDGKAQYDSAKGFIKQARQALAEKNLVFAGKLAEKAVNLANGLIGR